MLKEIHTKKEAFEFVMHNKYALTSIIIPSSFYIAIAIFSYALFMHPITNSWIPFFPNINPICPNTFCNPFDPAYYTASYNLFIHVFAFIGLIFFAFRIFPRKSISFLMKHLFKHDYELSEQVHIKLNNGLWFCDYCNYKTKSRTDVIQHTKENHINEIRSDYGLIY